MDISTFPTISDAELDELTKVLHLPSPAECSRFNRMRNNREHARRSRARKRDRVAKLQRDSDTLMLLTRMIMTCNTLDKLNDIRENLALAARFNEET